jgi:hypothetical protein
LQRWQPIPAEQIAQLAGAHHASAIAQVARRSAVLPEPTIPPGAREISDKRYLPDASPAFSIVRSYIVLLLTTVNGLTCGYARRHGSLNQPTRKSQFAVNPFEPD